MLFADTPNSIGPLTTYSKSAPTDTVLLFPNKTPDPSTLQGAHSLNSSALPPPPSSAYSSGPSGSSSSTTTTTTSSTRTSTSSSASSTTTSASPTPQPGLSTGSKVGIGVGVAGGVCLLAAIALVVFFLRRKKKSQNQNQETGTPWASPPPPGEKHGSWQNGPYSPGAPQGYHYDQNYPYHGVPAVIHEASYSPAEEAQIRKANNQPAEMEGEYDIPEVHANSRPLSTPAPTYTSEEGAR